MREWKGGAALPVIAVLTATAICASSGLFIKSLPFSSIAMTSLRMTTPFLLALPWAWRHGVVLGKPGMRKKLFLASALNGFRMLLFVIAFKLTSMGNAIVLLYIWPVFALLVESFKEKKPLGLSRVGVLLISLSGVVVMNLHNGLALSRGDLSGSLIMIVSAFVYAITAVMFKEALKEVKEVDTIFFQNAAGGIVFLPFLVAEIPGASLAHLGLGALYGLMVGYIGFGLIFFGMKRLSLFHYGALSYTEVPFGVLAGVLVLGESIRLNQLAGIVLVLGGSFMAQRLRSLPK
ncbi:MAG: DMT family transporter [Spirochaetia bacterium]|jgi:drug/metabolite transporter (DMT)-like permease|nr:DMT family transporter [Spirochaetales bacterium]MDX9783156.1 DMT family transporter [Spirochaetia bacterium]